MSIGAGDLLRMSKKQLDDLYRNSPPGPIPSGSGRGTAIAWPGTMLAGPAAGLARLLFWKGKVFNPAQGDLLNRVSPIGFRAIRAKVYVDDSWLDQRKTIVLDYSKTSFVAHKIRDEIREVAPGVYLGKVFWGRAHLLDFSLTFEAESA